MSRVKASVDALGNWLVAHQRLVLLVFLVLTAGFAVAATQIPQQAGTQQFMEDVPAWEANEEIQERFGTDAQITPERSSGQTTLIQQDSNVLSKQSLLRVAQIEVAVSERETLRVSATQSVAAQTARQLDPTATTPAERLDALETAPASEVTRAARTVATDNQLVSDDYNAESVTASATIISVQHETLDEVSESAGQSMNDPLTETQLETKQVVHEIDNSVLVFGSGLMSNEMTSIISDSLLIVMPIVVVLVFAFLLISFKDPIDMFAGLLALCMTLIWTLGFLGLVGIPFTQMMIALPPLLFAVGVDFGIHVVNRYREERADGHSRETAFRRTHNQIFIAFLLVVGTTIFGFGANALNDLGPIANFGIAAAAGMFFTLIIFGVFLPTFKLYLDEKRAGTRIANLSETPIGGGQFGGLKYFLNSGVVIAKYFAVVFLVLALLSSAMLAAYGTGIGTEFSEESMLPPEEDPAHLEYLPGFMQPGEYTVTETMSVLEENFETFSSDSVTIYIEGDLREESALTELDRANEALPESFLESDGETPEQQGLLTLIHQTAEQDPEFAALVDRNDRTGNGVPDKNLDAVYDKLLESNPAAAQYLTDTRDATRIQYAVDSDADNVEVKDDADAFADEFRYSATPTGSVIIMQDVSDVMSDAAFNTMVLSLALSFVFLILLYRLVEGQAMLGVLNVVPVLVAVAMLMGTMRYLGMNFNVLTSTILSVSIGLGVDYATHIVHRFADERAARDLDEYQVTHALADLRETMVGTGGALTGSMLTTVGGTATLALSITPILGDFGLLIALSIFCAYIASVLVVPPAVVVWVRVEQAL